MAIVKKQIVYVGIEDPNSPIELKVEIAGLKNLIKIAEELISRHEQVLTIIDLKSEAISAFTKKEDNGKENN